MGETFAFAYAMLAAGTAVSAVAMVIGWRRCRSVEFVLMPALVYYYTLSGAWQILQLKSEGGDSDALHHLEASLVTVRVDWDYVATLAVYALFLLVFWSATLIGARRAEPPAALRFPAFHIDRLLGCSLLALVASAWALWSELLSAIDQGVSLYLLTRGEATALFPVHQLANRVGLAALVLVWVDLLRTPRGVRARPFLAAVVAAVTVAWVGYLGALGNRNETVLAVLGGIYLFVMAGGRLRPVLMAAVGATGYFALRSVEILRAQPLDAMLPALLEAVVTAEFWNPTTVAGGSESLAAHVSLYGLMSTQAPWSDGSSLVYLVQSLVPFIRPDARVEDSYQLYARAVGAPDFQGFNIHFAAGAWLNGGVIAVVIAALLLAALFRGLRALTVARAGAAHGAMPPLAGYAFLCAMVPLAMRAGPEGLKALFFEGYALPFAVAWLTARRRTRVRRPQVRAGYPRGGEA